ncbi:MAG: hypothetical protein Q8S73_31475 [Deltaproteobacteria bacterium]|nr:hypothetical protein [Myxococcales bacterium]MDP3218667.1 hypothetical protein [Deltaproteobacteria bacterium]
MSFPIGATGRRMFEDRSCCGTPALATGSGSPPSGEPPTFLCGSEGYMTAVSEALAAAGVPAARVHVERFDAAGVAAAVSAPAGSA